MSDHQSNEQEAQKQKFYWVSNALINNEQMQAFLDI